MTSMDRIRSALGSSPGMGTTYSDVVLSSNNTVAQLKLALTSASVLVMPDYTKRFIVQTSNFGHVVFKSFLPLTQSQSIMQPQILDIKHRHSGWFEEIHHLS